MIKVCFILQNLCIDANVELPDRYEHDLYIPDFDDDISDDKNDHRPAHGRTAIAGFNAFVRHVRANPRER